MKRHLRKGREAKKRRQLRAALGNLTRGIETAAMWSEVQRIGPQKVAAAAREARS
jgi:hypothetical protein